MKNKFDFMVAGHLCLDLIPEFFDSGSRQLGEILHPGKLVNVGKCSMGTGGAVSNTGIALKKLGGNVCYCARVGDDEFGQIIMQILREYGSSAGISISKGSASSYSIVIAAPGIDRVFLHNPGANDEFSSSDIDFSLVSKCKFFHFGYPTLMRRTMQNEGRELVRIFKSAKSAGAITSCDMTLPDPDSPSGKQPWRKILGKLLPHVDIFFPSVEEVFFMLEPKKFIDMKRKHKGAELIHLLKPEEYSELSSSLLSMGAAMTSLKCGSRGWYFRTGAGARISALEKHSGLDLPSWSGRELWCPALLPKKIASATGAGDCSIAGFLKAMSCGLPLEKCLRVATCLGWQNLQSFDAVSGVRTWAETLSLVKKRIPAIDVKIEAKSWSQDKETGLFFGPNDSNR